MSDINWSKTEKNVARRAFDAAYRRECAALLVELRRMAAGINEPQDLWSIHDYLTEQRVTTDRKYDFRYSMLILVFARLLKEGWLTEADLDGLSKDKLDKIEVLAGM